MSTSTFTTELSLGDRCCFIRNDAANYGQVVGITITAGQNQNPPVHVVYKVRETGTAVGGEREVHSSKIAADKAGLLAKL